MEDRAHPLVVGGQAMTGTRLRCWLMALMFALTLFSLAFAGATDAHKKRLEPAQHAQQQ